MTVAAERDDRVTEPGECPICDAEPAACDEHQGAPLGPRGCQACNRAAFAEWLALAGTTRLCQGSGMCEPDVACPGCAACTTAATRCPAFALPDEPWISWLERSAPCVFCGGPPEAHRVMPPPAAELQPAEASEGAAVILRDPR